MNERARAHRRLVGRLVAATHNKGKLAEIRDLLAPFGVDVVGAGDSASPSRRRTATVSPPTPR